MIDIMIRKREKSLEELSRKKRTAVQEVVPMRERSCGAIVFREMDDEERVLLVQHKPGHWSFPKGHVEFDETDRQTAIREVSEETGVKIAITSDFERSSTYAPRRGVLKTVIFFIGEYLGGELIPQLEEVLQARWMLPQQAVPYLVFDRDKEIFMEALDYKCAGEQAVTR
ncbi:MAG TPA: NUDIX domain-containing protein [Clostridia bacterium]|nr:NUDIX domain-containing protein [Clostridia bacterium]